RSKAASPSFCPGWPTSGRSRSRSRTCPTATTRKSERGATRLARAALSLTLSRRRERGSEPAPLAQALAGERDGFLALREAEARQHRCARRRRVKRRDRDRRHADLGGEVAAEIEIAREAEPADVRQQEVRARDRQRRQIDRLQNRRQLRAPRGVRGAQLVVV